MKTIKGGRGKTHVSPTTRAIVDGEISLEELRTWSIEELVRGQRKNKNGNWTGRRPQILPAAIVTELARRQGRHALALLSSALIDAAQIVIDLAKKKKPERGDIVKLKACQFIFDYTIGRPPESLTVDLSAEGIVPPWQRLMAASIVANREELKRLEAGDIVEGEVVEEERPVKRLKAKRLH